VTHLYLIRHAASIEGLGEGKYRDLGLLPEGIHQSEQLRDRLAATQEIKRYRQELIQRCLTMRRSTAG
jgi:broad specificity phosphatase PhoE